MPPDHGQETNRRSHSIAEQIRAINETKDLNDRSYLLSVFAYDHFCDEDGFTKHDDGVLRDLINGSDANRVLIGPNIPNSNKNNSGELITKKSEGLKVYESDGSKIISVPQGYMYEVPDKPETLMTLILSNCTALIARKDGKLWVGHVSYSLDDEIEFFINKMVENGIDPKDIQVITLSGPDKVRYHHDEKNRANQFDSEAFWRGLGIAEQNMQRYDCNLVGNTFEGVIGVSILNGLLVTQRFDMTQKGIDKFDLSEARDVQSVLLNEK